MLEPVYVLLLLQNLRQAAVLTLAFVTPFTAAVGYGLGLAFSHAFLSEPIPTIPLGPVRLDLSGVIGTGVFTLLPSAGVIQSAIHEHRLEKSLAHQTRRSF